MKSTFFSRFVGFTAGFYAGSVGAIFVLTIVKTATFFPAHFSAWLADWMRYDVLPVALAELFRSPIMGLLFAGLGKRTQARASVAKWGLACGALSYTVAYFFTVLDSMGGRLADAITNFNLTETFLLGLPIVLVLLSRTLSAEQRLG